MASPIWLRLRHRRQAPQQGDLANLSLVLSPTRRNRQQNNRPNRVDSRRRAPIRWPRPSVDQPNHREGCQPSRRIRRSRRPEGRHLLALAAPPKRRQGRHLRIQRRHPHPPCLHPQGRLLRLCHPYPNQLRQSRAVARAPASAAAKVPVPEVAVADPKRPQQQPDPAKDQAKHRSARPNRISRRALPTPRRRRMPTRCR